MLTLMSRPYLDGNHWTRRALLRTGVLGLCGLTPPGPARAKAATRPRARRCILVFLNGGVSQLDTFDLKPDAPADIRGPYRPIATSAPGIFISEKLPRLAHQMHRVAIVRSMKHHLGAHNSSAAYALSGHDPGSDAKIAPTVDDHPTYGSVIARLSPPGPLPPFVLTPTYFFDMGFPTPSAGGGWLGRAYDPFPVVRNTMMAPLPRWEGVMPVPEGMALPPGVTPGRMKGRMSLSDQLEPDAAPIPVDRSDAFRRRALDLVLAPEARRAFDLTREPEKVRDRYGRCEMGQVLLLARRLVESGVRFVTANAVSSPPNTKLSSFQIWDTHFDHFRLYDSHLMPELDQALSALIEDLAERSLLEATLVVVTGEFGRTPRINKSEGGGRDHWAPAYSALLAGGGIRGGQAYGRTDAIAASVRDFPVRPDDLAATLYEAMGIPADTMLNDSQQRPRRLTDGLPVTALFG